MPLSENDVVDVINLRFVPLAYSVEDILKSPGALKRIRTIGKAQSAPQIWIVSPQGDVWYHTLMAGAPSLLREMRRVLAAHPDLNVPSAGEIEATDPLVRLDLAIRAGDRKRAEAIAADVRDDSARARILRARLGRRLGRTEAALAELDGLAGEDAGMERAYVLLAAKRWDEALQAIDAVEPAARAGEARYLRGLAAWLQRDDARAVELWTEAIRIAPLDPWSLRASWKMFALGMVGDSHVTESLR